MQLHANHVRIWSSGSPERRPLHWANLPKHYASHATVCILWLQAGSPHVHCTSACVPQRSWYTGAVAARIPKITGMDATTSCIAICAFANQSLRSLSSLCLTHVCSASMAIRHDSSASAYSAGRNNSSICCHAPLDMLSLKERRGAEDQRTLLTMGIVFADKLDQSQFSSLTVYMVHACGMMSVQMHGAMLLHSISTASNLIVLGRDYPSSGAQQLLLHC